MPFLSLIAILLLAPAPRQLYDVSSLQDRILEAVRSTLAERHPEDVHRLEVRIVRTGGRLDAELPVRIELPESAALPRAHLQVKVYQNAKNKWQIQGWAMLYISHYDSVSVTARTLNKDEQLSASDFRYAWIETTRFRGNPLTPERIRRLLARGDIFAHRHLNDQRILREGDVQNAFDVKLGQLVIMTYRRNQFALEFTCKARKNGFTGNEIKLFAQATNKTYRARITGPGKAEWLETLE